VTRDLDHILQGLPGAPAHGPGFDERLWTAVSEVDAELVPASLNAADDVVRDRRRAPRAWWMVPAVAALVVVAILVADSTRQAVHELREPPSASAAEVVAKMQHSLAKFKTLSATLETADGSVEGPPVLEPGWTSADWFARARVTTPAAPISDPRRIIATADGRLRVVIPVTGTTWRTAVRPDGTVEVTKDTPDLKFTREVPAESIQTMDDLVGVAGWYTPGYTYSGPGGSGGGTEQAMLDTGIALGPPDLDGFASSWMSTEGLSISAFSVLAQGTVTATTYDGRPALVVAAAVTPGPVIAGEDGESAMFYGEFDRIEVTVDKATWFPVRYTTRLHSDIVHDSRLTGVRLDRRVADSAFEPAFPKGVEVEAEDGGFRRVSLTQAQETFGYQALAPGRLPRGFRFFAAAVAPVSRFFVMTGVGDAGHEFWRASRDVTAIRYQSGFLAFTVTMRREQGMHDPLLADPFARDPSQVASSSDVRSVTIDRGALRGVTAKLAMPALGLPHLWAFHDGLMVTIAGDLTEGQLLKVAESLRPLK
jgi:hypothetical protein